MFQAAKSFFRDFRIRSDYTRHERACQEAHLAEAARRFDAGPLEREVAAIKKQAAQEAHTRFASDLDSLAAAFYACTTESASAQSRLAIFERDYRSERAELYARKQTLFLDRAKLRAEMRELKTARTASRLPQTQAYARLAAAKEDVADWHSKAQRTPWLFGNRDRKIPEHSIFGQSLGDLEDYKYERDRAVADIRSCKHEIARIEKAVHRNRARWQELSTAVGGVIEQIQVVKAARQEMFDLQRQGIRAGALRKIITGCATRSTALEQALALRRSERAAYIKEMEYRLGAAERTVEIGRVRAQRQQFLDLFHTPEAQVERRAEHRRQWLLERNIVEASP